MLLTDDFDNYGLDGQDNLKAWNRLPTSLKYFIHSQQNLITDKVVRKVKSVYGEDGYKSLVKTSGFRSVAVNNIFSFISKYFSRFLTYYFHFITIYPKASFFGQTNNFMSLRH